MDLGVFSPVFFGLSVLVLVLQTAFAMRADLADCKLLSRSGKWYLVVFLSLVSIALGKVNESMKVQDTSALWFSVLSILNLAMAAGGMLSVYLISRNRAARADAMRLEPRTTPDLSDLSNRGSHDS